ncbi:hypothetical protein ACXIVK_35735 [Paraburkholderia caledonica]
METIRGLLVWIRDLHNKGETDLVVAAQRRAGRRMFYALVTASIMCAISLIVAPDLPPTDTAPSAVELAWKLAVALAIGALAATVVGMGYIARYLVLLRWPERFVRMSD